MLPKEKSSGKKMVKKCIYCGSGIEDNSVIDFCRRCGVGVWGEKMFNTILKNMEDARANDDLCSTNTIAPAAKIKNSKKFEEEFF